MPGGLRLDRRCVFFFAGAVSQGIFREKPKFFLGRGRREK